MQFYLVSVIFSALLTVNVHASLRKESAIYKDGQTTLEGQIIYNSAYTTKRPAVLIVHQWMGITDHELGVAEKLADRGYIAFVVDIYGQNVKPKNTDEAGVLATRYKSDTKLFRGRLKAALDHIEKHKFVEKKKNVIIGYCFGGTAALEAARGQLNIVGAVSFHGGLSTPKPETTKRVHSKVLVLHGNLDPLVPATEVQAFFNEMNKAKADYQFVAYSDAVHAFTQKGAGSDPAKGFAYNERAEKRSWQALNTFLDEVASLGEALY